MVLADIDSATIVHISIIIGLFVFAAYIIIKEQFRSAKDVALDLLADDESITSEERFRSEDLQDEKKRKKLFEGLTFNDELGQAGLLDPEERAKFLMKRKVYPIVTPFVLLLLSFIAGKSSLDILLTTSIIGMGTGYLITSKNLDTSKKRFKSQIEFFLPVVMERIVMGVQAGLDIIPAVKRVLELDRQMASHNGDKLDPVSRLLGLSVRLTERGLTFDESLKDVSSAIDSSVLRHAFIHLGIAQREGGEIVFPLRELSDSTQLYYQETIEEEIAKLPIKATFPLLITFIGLLICFITSPAIEFSNLTQGITLQVPK